MGWWRRRAPERETPVTETTAPEAPAAPEVTYPPCTSGAGHLWLDVQRDGPAGREYATECQRPGCDVTADQAG